MIERFLKSVTRFFDKKRDKQRNLEPHFDRIEMKMALDPLIDGLVGDLRPTKPMKNWFAWVLAAISFAAISIWVVIYYGLRDDFDQAWLAGTILWKNGSLLLGSMSALAATIGLSRPDTKPHKILAALVVFIFAIIFWQLYELSTSSSLFYEMVHVNFGGAGVCIPVIVVGGLIVFSIIWQLWLKKSASQHPQELGAAAGLLSALLAASAYAFHCNMDNIFYFLFVYCFPIIGFGVFGYLIGDKLKW
jgi:hypothetical protein